MTLQGGLERPKEAESRFPQSKHSSRGPCGVGSELDSVGAPKSVRGNCSHGLSWSPVASSGMLRVARLLNENLIFLNEESYLKLKIHISETD